MRPCTVYELCARAGPISDGQPAKSDQSQKMNHRKEKISRTTMTIARQSKINLQVVVSDIFDFAIK